MLKLEELEIYKRSIKIGQDVWDIVLPWDYFLKDTMGKQLVRSADSIGANISEGYGRFFYKENKLFCFYSRGSLSETKTWLLKAHQRKLIKDEKYIELTKDLDLLHLKLNAYIKSIGAGK